MSDHPIVAFIEARLAEAAMVATSRVVWQLDHEGRGSSIHATVNHAKASAEQAEAEFGADTYWRYDDGNYWLKRDGETIATIRPVQVLGSDWVLLPADIASRRAILLEHGDVNDGDCGTCVVAEWGYPTHGGSTIARHPCKTVRLLAAPFASHPDYLAEWSVC